MNEVALLQSNKMAEAAKLHNIPFVVRQINDGTLSEKNGVYCIYGISQEDVDSVNRLDEDALYRFCAKQEADLTIAYPHCTVSKITDSRNLETAAMIIDNLVVFEFLRDKAKDFGLKINARKLFNGNISDIEVAYNESINPKRKMYDRRVFYDLVKRYLEFYDEDIPEKDFLEKHKEYKPETNTVHSIKAKNWVSNERYSCDELTLFRPNRTISSTAIEEKYLKEFEALMNKEEINYHIFPEAVICNDFGETDLPDDDFYEYMDRKPRIMHTVAFDSKFEGIANGFKYTKENEYLNKHKKELRYDSNVSYSVFLIPRLWINYVTAELAANDNEVIDKNDDDIIFDVRGAYVSSSYESFGLIAASEAGRKKITTAMVHALECHTKEKIINYEQEKEMLGDYAQIAAKKHKTLPFFGESR